METCRAASIFCNSNVDGRQEKETAITVSDTAVRVNFPAPVRFELNYMTPSNLDTQLLERVRCSIWVYALIGDSIRGSIKASRPVLHAEQVANERTRYR